MRMIEFLLQECEPTDGYEALLTTVLQQPVKLVSSFEDAPAEGAWGTIEALDGDFCSHVQLFRVADDALGGDEQLYRAVGSAVGCAVLVADDASENPYEFRVFRDGLWSHQTVVASRLDDDGAYVLHHGSPPAGATDPVRPVHEPD